MAGMTRVEAEKRLTGDKTKCERTKCECEASVTANQ